MAIEMLSIAGYRSLREIALPLGPLNVVTGPNGSGKSNLYRALGLIARIAEGDFAPSIAREGGLLSAMWAGPRTSKKPLRLSLGFRAAEFSFQLDCGFPTPSDQTVFAYDPQIKEEAVWFGNRRTPSSTLLHRSIGNTWVRDAEGNRVDYPLILSENESVLSQLREPNRFPELFTIRDEIRGWRFYHAFRTDEDAALRSPRVSVRTPILSHDGADLAAALQTILEGTNGGQLERAIAAAFPNRSLRIVSNEPDRWTKSPQCTELCVALETPGCARPLLARELSDGTLKFLCLAAALLSPKPPAMIVLNEPESSLHPDLLNALAALIVAASAHSQVAVCTHSQPLVASIIDYSGVQPIQLRLERGETVVSPST